MNVIQWSNYPYYALFLVWMKKSCWWLMVHRLAFLCCVATISICSPLEDEGSVQFISVAKSYPTLYNSMNHSTPGFPVHHQHLEFTRTHVHRIGDAIQRSHPLSSPSPPAPTPFQHQGLFQWVNSLHEVAEVLEFQRQHQSFQWTPRTDLL